MVSKTVYDWMRTPANEELLPVPRTSSGGYICPVCGVVAEEYLEPAWGTNRTVKASNGIDYIGGPSYEICGCCNTQFGLDDMCFGYSTDGTVQSAWRGLRQKWLESRGHSPEAYKQLESIPELTAPQKFERP